MDPAVKPQAGHTAVAAVCRGTIKQECIPEGCVPPALYRTGVSVWGVSLDRDHLGQRPLWTETHPLDRDSPDRDPPGQRPPLERDHPRQRPLVNRITDRCKNITLAQTSFAGGNYRSGTVNFQSEKSFGKLRMRAFQPYHQILCMLKHVEDVEDGKRTYRHTFIIPFLIWYHLNVILCMSKMLKIDQIHLTL